MDRNRRTILSLGVATAALATSGCVTKKLWADYNRGYYDSDHYKHSIELDAILISEDGRKLVVFAKDNNNKNKHYIFDSNTSFLPILNSDLRSKLRCNFSMFTIDKKSKISGLYDIYLEERDLTHEEKAKATALGFFLSSSHNESDSIYILDRKSARINGVVYDASGFNLSSLPSQYKLNRTYKIQIHEEHEPTSVPLTKSIPAKEILLTPVSVVADVGIVIMTPVGIVLLPFAIMMTGPYAARAIQLLIIELNK